MPSKNNFKTCADMPDLKGKRVLVRVDLNVPLGENGVVDESEAWRIHAIIPTLTHLMERGARVMVVSHLGREGESLKPVAEYLAKHVQVGFVPEVPGREVAHFIESMQHGSATLFENIRRDEREKANDPSFAKELAGLVDYYVNDAFSVSHRSHTSIVGVPTYLPAYAGLQFEREVAHLDMARDPKKPLLVVIAGVKFETKLPLIELFLDVADYVFVGGALAHPIFREHGYEIGTSVYDDAVDVASFARNEKVILPTDVVLDTGEVVIPQNVPADRSIMDAGPETIAALETLVKKSETVLWNGPLGNYIQGFEDGTEQFARMLARYRATQVIGGGDTVEILNAHKLLDRYTFVSTAGGAMLDYLVDGSLVGIDALVASNQ